ncbi:SRPBCC family protein [bacterium]|nr:SRPBCC family protein [bacterium]
MHKYQDSIIVEAPVERVFTFYTDLKNLARMTLPEYNMRIVRAEIPLRQGSRIRFSLRPRGIPIEVKWDSVICEFEENRAFADCQTKGPFEHWVHRHEFDALDDHRTRVTDTIEMGAPLGLFGRMAESLFVSSRLERMFEHRKRVVKKGVE